MAASNSGTVDIAVYTTLDKEDNKNILSFIVQDEYHLKKLAVGAYSLNILDTQLLNDLSERNCSTISCGNFVICHNFTEQKNNALNAILFNTKPTILKKGVCIFKIVYVDAAAFATACCRNSKTAHCQRQKPQSQPDVCRFKEISVVKANNNNIVNDPNGSVTLPDSTTLATTLVNDVHEDNGDVVNNKIDSSQRHDSLFINTFGADNDYDEEDDDDENEKGDEENHDGADDADELLPPFKRQKLDDSQ
ncbi:tlp-20 [Orgyia leucostigma nucleopolyhedrovirus]|uniref:Tlp-20 n=1 Tax=Orgyia leucostigma nucleopolyhedrovirus TaxID=490711 RepID=B0FDU2_9ABAC|nr:tlp-20 [Orgyia leucostigma nucleopolyhedrovirus]ABY65800.1 tlp-20 [Orgyia leucostigma nucleopolyhedrovirus]